MQERISSSSSIAQTRAVKGSRAKPTPQRWELLLSRWSEISECGEKRLMCALLGRAIHDALSQPEVLGALLHGGPFKLADEPTRRELDIAYFSAGGGFEKHLALLGVDADFVRRQAKRHVDFDWAAYNLSH